jgi:predicted 3-demethylubiquinone-9 3-methyltransferase (glyoxalase superfamily)
MQKISTHLWFDKEAKEAADFYTSIFADSKILNSTTLNDTPSGSVDVVDIMLRGQKFTLISAGPLFRFNPSVSFIIACETMEEVDILWSKLSEGGSVLMELQEYPFSKKFGWTADKYGLSWQIMHTGDSSSQAKITPSLLFVGDNVGRAEEAINFYTSVFHNSSIDFMLKYEAGEEPDKAGTVKHAGFTLEGKHFAAMDSAHKHEFAFNEAISFVVNCENQDEIDYYWEKLSAVPESEQCGWLKDRYGLSWQIVPTIMNEMFKDKDPEKMAKVTQAFLKMKKFDIVELKKAAESS